jgi:hypothetical protein
VSFIDPLRKVLFSRLPIKILHHLSLYPTAALWCALRFGLQRTELLRLSFRHTRLIGLDVIPTHCELLAKGDRRADELAMFGAGAALYILVLSRLALNAAQSMLALRYAGVMLGSAWVLGEPMPPIRLLGAAMIVVGVAIVAWSTFG